MNLFRENWIPLDTVLVGNSDSNGSKNGMGNSRRSWYCLGYLLYDETPTTAYFKTRITDNSRIVVFSYEMFGKNSRNGKNPKISILVRCSQLYACVLFTCCIFRGMR